VVGYELVGCEGRPASSGGRSRGKEREFHCRLPDCDCRFDPWPLSAAHRKSKIGMGGKSSGGSGKSASPIRRRRSFRGCDRPDGLCLVPAPSIVAAARSHRQDCSCRAREIGDFRWQTFFEKTIPLSC
jgi:hypothetical protein